MRPKAHHKVPRYYLEGFRTDDSGTGKKARLWVYRDGESQPRRTNPSKTAFENDFYSLIGPDGERDATLELLLAKHVDTPASEIWHKLTDSSASLTSEERAQIAIFIAFLFTRTSSMRRTIGSLMGRVEDMARQLMDTARQRRAEDPSWQPTTFPPTPGGHHYVIESREDLEALRPTHNDLVRMTGTGVEKIAAIIASMNWTAFSGPDDARFITSDNPVSRDNPIAKRDDLRADIESVGAEISLPLTRRCCLVCSHHGPEAHVRVGADTVDLLNHRTMGWYESEVYSSGREGWLDEAFSSERTHDDER